MDNVLGSPPPPPPPNVPALDTNKNPTGKVLTLRERMEAHRANPVCASCHGRMDPLGFSLENFDATGQWRVRDGSTVIDNSASLPDGTKFAGPSGLRDYLLTRPFQFSTALTEKLLAYSLGRGLEPYDVPAVRKIVNGAVPDYKFSGADPRRGQEHAVPDAEVERDRSGGAGHHLRSQ